MHPRILLRTHYEADEPRLIIAAATHCSSPARSKHEDAIALSLKTWARSNGYVISTPGAVYAVGNARHLGLLTNNNHWTASGMAFAFVEHITSPSSPCTKPRLTPLEERLYLKLYLAGAGGLVVKFASWLVQQGSVSDEQIRTGSVLEKLMIDALDEYLSLTTEVRDRVAIRKEKERLGRTEYAASTKRHKRYPLLRTMERLRLLQRSGSSEDAAIIEPDAEGRLAALSRALPDVKTLEHLIRGAKLQETMDTELHEYRRDDLPVVEKPESLLARAYTFAMGTGMQACSLSFLDDVLWSVFPATPAGMTPSAERMLEPLHRERPGEVRFHVNRRGQRAFVLMSNEVVGRLGR